MLATNTKSTDTLHPTSNGTAVDVKRTESISVSAQDSQMLRTRSGGFSTSDGTLYVSKPFRTVGNKKSRAIISFVPRNSTFDPQNTAGPNEFRGFFSLFWISMFLLVVQNYVVSFEKNGYPIELAFAAMFSRHALTLALSDGVLVLSTGFCVPFAIALKKGWLNFTPWGVVIQHTFQTLVLAIAVTWTFNRKWPWVQSGFLTLHSLVMIMKMHSYMSTNGYLQNVSRNFDNTMAKLRSTTSHVGGWDVALVEAAAHAVDMHVSGATPEEVAASPSVTPMSDGTQRSYIDGDMALALRKKLLAVPEEKSGSVTSDHDNSSSQANGVSSLKEKDPKSDYAVLIHHPNQDISMVAQELVEMDLELTSQGPNKVRWPDNISLKSFADYMIIPILVYELEYPRTDRIRPFYVFEKTVATFGTFALLYTITENFILPLVPTSRDQSFFRSLLDLALPFMIAYLLLFYIIFGRHIPNRCLSEYALTLLQNASVTGLQSYLVSQTGSSMKTGWNSTSWDEFARKWNKPVHTFLLRHVYASSMTSYKLSKKSAMFVTFFLSASVHELVMAIVTKKIRMYLFMLQLIQIPLIAIGRIPFIKRNKVLGNVVFWIGLYAGFPLLCVAYCAY